LAHEMFLAEDFQGRNAKNVYEAIIAIARRARQIGEAHRKEMDSYLTQVDSLERFQEDEEAYDEPLVAHEPVLQFEKPTILALREMIAEKLDLIRQEVSFDQEKDAAETGAFPGKLDLSGEDEPLPASFPSKLSLLDESEDQGA